jgi:hypothetical protein
MKKRGETTLMNCCCFFKLLYCIMIGLSLLLFNNTPLTPSAIRLVPEVIGSVLVAALIPVLARELQGEVGQA